jgi:hypothetical protein
MGVFTIIINGVRTKSNCSKCLTSHEGTLRPLIRRGPCPRVRTRTASGPSSSRLQRFQPPVTSSDTQSFVSQYLVACFSKVLCVRHSSRSIIGIPFATSTLESRYVLLKYHHRKIKKELTDPRTYIHIRPGFRSSWLTRKCTRLRGAV